MKRVEVLDNEGNVTNIILCDDNDSRINDTIMHRVVDDLVLSTPPVRKHYSHLDILRQFPRNTIKAILQADKVGNNIDLMLWKYMFDRAASIDSTDAEFVSGIAFLKSEGLLPADWELQ